MHPHICINKLYIISIYQKQAIYLIIKPLSYQHIFPAIKTKPGKLPRADGIGIFSIRYIPFIYDLKIFIEQ